MKNIYLIVAFLTFLLAGLWKLWAWIIWKYLNLTKDKQVFNLLAKSRFIEIIGPSGKGKSWLLCHLFKNLKGVKFTNMPTPQGLYTLNKNTWKQHWIGQWAAPNRFFYFLDDIDKTSHWAKKELGEGGRQQWNEYIANAGKLGGTFIWTNNGLDTPQPFANNRNEKWIVQWYISFMGYSLLCIFKGWQPIFIPIDNKEIEAFYDSHWNVNHEWNKNWISEVAKRLQGKELSDLVEAVNDREDLPREYDRAILLKYLEERTKEEQTYKKQQTSNKKIWDDLRRFGIKDGKLDLERLKKYDKKQALKKELKSRDKKASKEEENNEEKE